MGVEYETATIVCALDAPQFEALHAVVENYIGLVREGELTGEQHTDRADTLNGIQFVFADEPGAAVMEAVAPRLPQRYLRARLVAEAATTGVLVRVHDVDCHGGVEELRVDPEDVEVTPDGRLCILVAPEDDAEDTHVSETRDGGEG